MKNIITFVLFLFCTIGTFAQNINTGKLDSLFQLLEQNEKFMGSIEISHDQRTLYSNSIGFVDVENSVKVDKGTKFRIGSISKMFTATIALKAIEEGKLELDQSIEEFFPHIENADKITIKNLLNHSTGIHDFTREENYSDWNSRVQTRGKMISRISDFKSDFEPNSRSEYSNSNFVLLTYILEDVYDKPFSKILKDEIVEPLGFQDTYYGGKINTDENEANSYSFLGKWDREKETDMSVPQGAGAIVSNPEDLNTFIENLFLGNIVSKESLNLMKDIKNGYGLGLLKFPYKGRVSYGHTGGIDGFESVTSYFPEEKLAISLTANGVNYDKNEILLSVLDSFFNKDFELPHFENTKLTSADLEEYLGTYSSEEIPPKINISKEGNTLLAQATGQPAFPLDPVDKNTFIFEQAGVKIEFDSSKTAFILKQGGGEFHFTKD